jgi:hypothetical protein
VKSFKKIAYENLKPRQKEVYNFQVVAGFLAEYGFNCIKLADDWQGADFLAYHIDGKTTLKVQLKSRPTISKKYSGKSIYVAFPMGPIWYMIEHDKLVKLAGKKSSWLNSKSWNDQQSYSSRFPNKKFWLAIYQQSLVLGHHVKN